MSSVSGLGGLGAEAFQSPWQVTGQSAAGGASRPQGPPPNGGGPPPGGMWEDIEESATTAGLDEEEIETLRTDLKDAISSALESVGSSDDPEAKREAVDSAILTTLEEYGVDTEQLESRMEEAKNRMGSMPPPGQGQAQNAGAQLNEQSGLLLMPSSGSEEDDASELMSMLFPLIDEEA